MIERRKYIRLGQTVKITYKVTSSSYKHSGYIIENFGGGGIRMILEKRLPPGTILDLDIKLPDIKEPIIVKGEIVWLDVRKGKSKEFPFVAGVKFVKIDPFECGKILKYVGKKIKGEGLSDKENQENQNINWLG